MYKYKKNNIKILHIAVLLLSIGVYSCYQSEGKMISFEGYELYVEDMGVGEPTIIIENGLNCFTSYYDDLQEDLSEYYRVISYDHAGIGKSTPNYNPRTLPYYVEELKVLMDSLTLKPPYVLIGHSLGGHIIRYYTHIYPNEVAALVFIDHPHEDWFKHIRSHWADDEKSEYFKWWDVSINGQEYKGTGLAEVSEYEANCDSIRGKEIPSDIPVLMFTGNNRAHFRKSEAGINEDKKKWAKLQYSLISKVKKKKQIIDWQAGHNFHNDKPKLAKEEILKFIDSIKIH